MKEVYIRVKGRVQGVGYRQWAVRVAAEIGGISGWVRNVETGDVEILMKGSDDKVDQMLAACHEGPQWARVDKIEFLGGRLSGFLPPIEEGLFKRI